MLRKTGFSEVDSWSGWVLGADEAGWGAMAGPLVVAAAAAPVNWQDPRITDSKMLTPKKREALFSEYRRKPEFCIRIVAVSSEDIDRKGPQKARIEAFQEVLSESLSLCPSEPLVVVDGNLELSVAARMVAYPKADLKVPEVGLASIFAKVGRDLMMVKLGREFPQYNWGKNKGYVTKDHQESLEKYGPCKHHRRSYSPVANIISRIANDNMLGLWDDD